MARQATGAHGPRDIRPPVSLDISRITAPDPQAVWFQWILRAFPHLHPEHVGKWNGAGIIRNTHLGLGDLLYLRAWQQTFAGAASSSSGNGEASLMLQLEGRTSVRHGKAMCVLGPGDITLLDDRKPSRVEIHGDGAGIILLFPRILGSGLFPQLLRHTAEIHPASQPEVKLLASALQSANEWAQDCSSESRFCLMQSLLHLMAGLSVPREVEGGSWRVRQGLRDIVTGLSEGAVRAEEIANGQNVSRRRLDELFKRYLGKTVADQIAESRLAQATAALSNPALGRTSITDIALAAGFADSSHFSKAFRQRFDMSPGEWRARFKGER